MKTSVDEHNFCCRCGNSVNAGQNHHDQGGKQPVATSSGNQYQNRKGGFWNFMVVLFIAGALLAFKREILQDMLRSGQHRAWVNPVVQPVNRTRRTTIRRPSQAQATGSGGTSVRTRGR